MKVNPSRTLLPPEKLMLVPEDVPKVAVPVSVTLPGTVAGFQFALALKSKLPATAPATVGVASQVASCAKAGVTPNSVPIPTAASAADRQALRTTLPTQRPPVLTEISTAPPTCLFISPTPAFHALYADGRLIQIFQARRLSNRIRKINSTLHFLVLRGAAGG